MSDMRTDEREELERLLAPGAPDAPAPDFERMWERAEYEVEQRARTPRYIQVAAAAILAIIAGALLFALIGDRPSATAPPHQGAPVAERPSPHPFEGGGEESAARVGEAWEAPTDFLLDEALAMEAVAFQSTELELGGESF